MALDTVALEIGGQVSLREFNLVVNRLHGLLNTLSATAGEHADIDWLIDGMHAAGAESALTAYRGQPSGNTNLAQVEQVVRAYGDVGTALEADAVATLSSKVAGEALRLARILNGRVTTLRFETPEVDATITTAVAREDPQSVPAFRPGPTVLPATYGAIEGRIQTLSSRGGLRFTLYDTLHDRAVSCYMADDFDPQRMREAWGRRAIVAGLLTRDPATGRPRTIRQVGDVVVLPEFAPDDYRLARGSFPVAPGAEPPELRLRRLRDAD